MSAGQTPLSEITEGSSVLVPAPYINGVGTEGFVGVRTAGTRYRHRRGWLVRRLLLTADLLGLVLAFAIVAVAFPDQGAASALATRYEILLFACSLPIWVVAFKLYGLYDRDDERTDHSTTDEIASVVHLITLALFVFFASSWIFGLVSPYQAKVAVFWAAAVGLVVTGRIAARALARRLPSYVQRVVIVGAGDVGQVIGRKIASHPEYGLQLVGFVDARPKSPRLDLDDLTIVGEPDDLLAIVAKHDVERVIVAFSNESHAETLRLIRMLEKADVQIDIVPRLFEILSAPLLQNSIEGMPVLTLPRFRLARSSRLLKLVIDFLLAALLLLLLSPLFLVTGLLIKLESRGPVFFRQTRAGVGGKPFRIFKFRTMTVDADERKSELAELNKHALAGDGRMFKVPHDPRVTRVGRVLRRYSLDELPQLLNVLNGEMSLVGPRPLILEESVHVSSWARKRLELRPGITGLWQITGRSEMSFDEMVRLDYLYVTNWSLAQDLKILARTAPAVLRARDY